MRKLVLFDIDGTLLHTAGAGRRAIRHALLARFGAEGSFGHVRFDGKTDPQIVRELLVAAGHPERDSAKKIQLICEEYVELLELELRACRRNVRLFPGVELLMDRLETRAEVLVGLVTGNVERGARLKLQFAGLDPSRFRIGAFGSDAANRERLPPLACERAETLMGGRPLGEEVVIIGDTPADMTCGASVGARALGVATGSYSERELLAAGAYAAFSDLADTSAVEAAIFA